ncbi:N,N-dimethylformamidase beta subunit family domain-containing protein [Sphaerisporangium sp. NPDC088356]|uniref:N,N-dimethylformamidase beta subunit family domain-containing protein n=1 Tax=Sphaerisporangium sp. NPDC088356 TaxID=3154871 RepID=UPI0034409B02
MAIDGVFGYTDKLSYAPGDRMTVMAGGPAGDAIVQVDLVELTSQGWAGVPWDAAGSYTCSPAKHCVGSFAVADRVGDGVLPSAFTWGAWVFPTSPESRTTQAILGWWEDGAGMGLAIDDGVFTFTARDGEELDIQLRAADTPVRRATWYFVAVQVQGDSARLSVSEADSWSAPVEVANAAEPGLRSLAVPRRLAIAASEIDFVETSGAGPRGRARDTFNGKIEAPFLIRRVLSDQEIAECAAGDTGMPLRHPTEVIGAWQLGLGVVGNDSVMAGLAGSPEALAVNLPARGVTGVRWTGNVTHFELAPDEYAAAHFHVDDLMDVGWRPLFDATLPAQLASNLYGVRLRHGESTDVIPITVVPVQPPAPILVIMPVFTYLAYANEHMFEGDVSGLRPDITLDDRDPLRTGHPEYGRSQYDTHADGSGVFFSSAARAILTMRTDYEMWLTESARGYSGELYLLRWLRDNGYSFDLVTDLEVHQRGSEMLSQYRVVITGAHPEYVSQEMLDGIRGYLDQGGKLMYLGGNGFYHVTGVYSNDPLITELRRGNAGVRAWDSAPGEGVLISTGRPGGLWRHRGQAPQSLVGVGFCAQGWDKSSPYRRTQQSYEPATSWIFDGVDGEVFGTVGAVRGGAAGDEIDRFDATLGAPPQTVVLATSFGHSDQYQRSIEELTMTLPGLGGGETDPEVHADVTFAELPSGGAVFSVGSIAWTGSLSERHLDKGVVTITANVLNRFLATGPDDTATAETAEA